ncbi:Ribosomal protein L7A/L8 [Gracilaria domingensis]|nr:Ribosomal protein L7A/L8 [Gracilaria domingensis]
MPAEKKKGPSRKIQKKKIWGSKQVLSSPFAFTFPSANAGTKDAVLQIFAKQFPEPFARRESRPSRRARNHERIRNEQEVGRKAEQRMSKKPLRILCGINEVTRALEKKKVELVIVSRDVTPSFLITHIPVLCFLNSATLVVLSGDGTELGHILGTRRLLALCILKEISGNSEKSQSVDFLVEKLKPYSVVLDYPWLAAIRGETTPRLPDPSMVPHKTKKELLAPLQK